MVPGTKLSPEPSPKLAFTVCCLFIQKECHSRGMITGIFAINLTDLQGRHTDQGEDDGENPEADSDAVFVSIHHFSFFDG